MFCRHSRVEPVEEVVDVRADDVTVGVHLVEDLRVRLVLAEPTHLLWPVRACMHASQEHDG